MASSTPKRADQVFGISHEILPDSYVDRRALDTTLQTQLGRSTHVALRGESKCGKSWLRQHLVPDAIVVQCRLQKPVEELFIDALSQLGIRLELQATNERTMKGRVEAETSFGTKLLAKLSLGASFGLEGKKGATSQNVGRDINDLKFVADLLKASERRLVIEDFHYMSQDERKKFAFDLKALWDYGLFIVIVGVWSQSNMLLHLNPDLTGRVHEEAIYWSNPDLEKVMVKGGEALNICFTKQFRDAAVDVCFGSVGILQALILRTLDELGIAAHEEEQRQVADTEQLDSAAMLHAEQLNAVYQEFAKRVSEGIRARKDSTGIYAHAMAAILEQPDADLQRGVKFGTIYKLAHAREPRIQPGNLRSVLRKFEQLQIDEAGRGLVLSYNDIAREVLVVDRQLLLYRKYSTIQWPWKELIREATAEPEPTKATPDDKHQI